MKRKVLIADNDVTIREKLKAQFNDSFEIVEATTGEEALRLFHSQQIDLILLDLVMPKKDGFTVLTEIRKVSQVPVMIVTARSGMEDQIKAFELQADSYTTKPIEMRLLSAKVKRLMARLYPEEEVVNYEFAFNGLVANKLARSVRIDNDLVNFRPKEFDLLMFLIENHGVALDRDKILDAVWGIDYFGDTRVVDTHVKKIRKKLGTYSNYVHTIFSVGYKFEVVEVR